MKTEALRYNGTLYVTLFSVVDVYGPSGVTCHFVFLFVCQMALLVKLPRRLSQ